MAAPAVARDNPEMPESVAVVVKQERAEFLGHMKAQPFVTQDGLVHYPPPAWSLWCNQKRYSPLHRRMHVEVEAQGVIVGNVIYDMLAVRGDSKAILSRGQCRADDIEFGLGDQKPLMRLLDRRGVSRIIHQCGQGHLAV